MPEHEEVTLACTPPRGYGEGRNGSVCLSSAGKERGTRPLPGDGSGVRGKHVGEPPAPAVPPLWDGEGGESRSVCRHGLV